MYHNDLIYATEEIKVHSLMNVLHCLHLPKVFTKLFLPPKVLSHAVIVIKLFR